MKCPNCGGELHARYEGSVPLRFSDKDQLFDASVSTMDLDLVIFCIACQKTIEELGLYSFFTDDVMCGYVHEVEE